MSVKDFLVESLQIFIYSTIFGFGAFFGVQLFFRVIG